jgi:polyisoprenyl-phosphate glycosyltransferase
MGKRELMGSTQGMPDYVVSVCCVVSEWSEAATAAARDLLEILERHYQYYELLIVDCCPSGQEAVSLAGLAGEMPGVRILRLSRNVGLDVGLAAALEHVIGDYVVALDLVLDPPRIVPDVLDQLVSGHDFVVGEVVETLPQSLNQRMRRAVLKAASAVLRTKLEAGSITCIGFSRRAVNAVTRIRSKARFIVYEIARVGFRRAIFKYEQRAIPGCAIRRPPVREAVVAASQMIIANSMVPLRIASALGLLASVLNLAYLLYIFGVVLLKRQIAEGWLTTSLTHTTMFLILFLILMVMTEYIARLMEESRDCPLYFIEQELASTTSTYDKHRINVVS